MLLPIFVGEDWKWNLTFSEFFFATEGKILGDFFQKMSGPMSGETKVKMPFLQQKKKPETLSRVNRCIFLGVFVQSAIGTARRQMKQCIQSTCGIKHLKRPTVRVFPLWEIIAYNDSTYTVRKIKKAAQVLQAFVDLTWFNSESQRDLLDPYSFAPLFSKMAFQVSVFKLVSKWKYSKLGCL